MSDLLQPGQKIATRSGSQCTVEKFLGSGGQGEVYKASWEGHDVALKWYYKHQATANQLRGLEELVKEGKPSDRFLWPNDIAESQGVPGFGYIMGLRPNNYKSLFDLVAGRVSPPAFALVQFSLGLCKAFRALHKNGLCYRDISFGNAFFEPTTGDVLICDNDNVTTNRSPITGVLGTPDFMAPEVVRGEAVPSTSTDLHSLAVLLFYTLFIGHPLLGKKVLNIRMLDSPAREKLFGNEPIFIFDPQDTSNAAVDFNNDPTGEAGGNPLKYWGIYPEVLRKIFIKAFTAALNDPNARVTELEWLEALTRFRDSYFKCVCGTPNYYDTALFLGDAYVGKCWSCHKVLKLPFRMRLDNSVVMLHAEAKLYPHHLHDGRDFDFSEAVAELAQHPKDPNIWGLKNLTNDRWVVTMPDGSPRDVEPGRSAPLLVNAKISFGRVVGEIRY